MRTGFAEQYNTASIVVEPDDDLDPDELIEACQKAGACFYEDGPDDECYVVVLRPDIGPEIWTERALRGSLAARARNQESAP